MIIYFDFLHVCAFHKKQQIFGFLTTMLLLACSRFLVWLKISQHFLEVLCVGVFAFELMTLIFRMISRLDWKIRNRKLRTVIFQFPPAICPPKRAESEKPICYFMPHFLFIVRFKNSVRMLSFRGFVICKVIFLIYYKNQCISIY